MKAEDDHERDRQDGERNAEIEGEHGVEAESMTRGRCVRAILLGLAAALAAVLALSLSRARAATPERYDVEARVDVEAGRIVTRTEIQLRVEQGESVVRLWLYADRLAVAPRVMDGRSARWIYPGEISLGGVDVTRVTVDGVAVEVSRHALDEGAQERPDRPAIRARDFGGSDLVVPLPPGPSRVVRITIESSLSVPDRFGRLGRAGARLALAGPWYPLVLGEGDGLPAALHRVRAQLVHGVGAGPDGRVSDALRVERQGAYVPLVAGADLEARSAPLEGGRSLVVVDRRDAYEAPTQRAEGLDALADLAGIDRVASIREAALDVVRTADWLGIAVPDPLVVFVVPSRTELAATAPGVALVSDRIFQIFPIADLREFHLRAMRRALFGVLVQGASAQDPIEDAPWVEDLRAAALEDADEARRHASRGRADRLLEPFSFHPAVDQLLNAPQVAFEDVYFGTVDEVDRFRDDPLRARFPYAHGRRLLTSIADAIDAPAMRRLIAMLARGRRSVRSAIERVAPGSSARLAEWIRYPSLEVNYRLGAIESEPIEGGGEGEGPRHRHRVHIRREGDERREPVEIEIEDDGGERTIGRWDGEGEEGVVVIETRGAFRRAVIDPRMRVSESARVAPGHPRADDESSPSWRLPLFNNFSIDVLASEGNVTGFADITIRPRYDLDHLLVLRAVRTVARTTGRARYLHGLGPVITGNRRMVHLGGGLAFGRIEPGFATSALGGYSLELELSGSLSTERFIADPRDGVTASVQLGGGGTLRDDGSLALAARGSFRVSGIVPVGLLQAFFFLGAGGFSAGATLDAERQSLGGRYALRGFANDELIGDGVLYGVIEHRYTLLGDLAINLLHAVWVREVQLVTWVGAGGVFGTLEGEDARFAAEGGAGLRFHYEYGGVQPGLLALDLAVPISRLATQPPSAVGARSPVTFYVSFDQYF